MIEGTLVNLRAMEMDDLERNEAWFNDIEVTRYLGRGYGISRAAEEAWMRQRAGRPVAFDNAAFAIVMKDGRHIGNAELFGASVEDRTAEVGITIGDRSCWSQGYGSDALVTLLRFGFDEMNLNRAELNVLAANDHAIRCYERCGFVTEGRKRQEAYRHGAHQDVLIMSVLRDEFYARHGATADR